MLTNLALDCPPVLVLMKGTALFTPLAIAVFVVKSMFLVFVMMWVRWTVPRIRIDQVMALGYKYLTPIGLFLVLVASVWEYIKFSMMGV